MAETLKSLAGATFKSADVIATFHSPIAPERAILDRYVFLPHARTGIAAALNNGFAWDLPARGKVEIKVPVIDDGGPLDAEMTVNVHGPADVVEIDPRQVIRAFPKADGADAEIDDLVHVEFDRPDLPWLFTPAGPDAAGQLVPWITLVVAERRHIQWGEQRGATRIAAIRRDQLQSLADAWAWAHAQVVGPKAVKAPGLPEPEPTLARRLSEANAAHNLSRLVCPRRLDDATRYVACVVPTFSCGRQAGLGLAADPQLTPAWGAFPDFGAGEPDSVVELPVYYSWSFATGESGNFETLARKLKPRAAPPGVGRRRVDATRPWTPAPLLAGDSGAEVVVKGPVVSPQDPEALPQAFPEEHWPTEERQHWPAHVTDELVTRLNRADEQAHVRVPGPMLVGPPLYGSNHARQPRIETDAAAAAAQPAWLRELNRDPRHRIVGGLGTRVIQSEQETFVAGAWNQVIGVEAANRALRLAQLAKHVSTSLHERHLARLSDAAIVAITERVHAKVLDAPQRSVAAALDDSSLPTTATVGAFRRLARVRGPVARRAVPDDRTQRALAVESLTVRAEDSLTTNWVRAYANPDGIGAISALAKSHVTDAIAARVAPGVDRERLLAGWDEELPRPAPSDRLTPDGLAGAQVPDTVDVGRELRAMLARRLLTTLPLPREFRPDHELLASALLHTKLLLAGLLDGDLEMPPSLAQRLGLAAVAIPADDPANVILGADALQRFVAGVQRVARAEDRNNTNVEEIAASEGRLREIVDESASLPGRALLAGFEELAAGLVVDDPFVDKARQRIDAPALAVGLVARLDPARTVPARIAARLTGGTGRLPRWLRAGWFDDDRIEPVMAHPRFHEPMYKPLHRYDREWMVPGLGLIERPDMATLLQTNNRFIEAYVVGLNHELGRELLWREYPTDQRGTYFDSFWTGQRELVADLHERPWRDGALGTHLLGADGRLVLLVRGDLVRRYPGVVAHAVRQATDDHGVLLQDRGVPLFEFATGESPIKTLFHVHLAPNVLLVGFDMSRARIGAAGETWWFTLSENPTEPRFGLDATRPEAQPTRDNLIWSDFGLPVSSDVPGQFLDALRQAPGIRFRSLEAPLEDSTWGASSAEVARLLFQLPARAAFLGTRMVSGAVPG